LVVAGGVFAQQTDLEAGAKPKSSSPDVVMPDVVMPNVVMIAIDDLNDWVGPLGGHPQVKTPWIDSLAKRGVTFTNAHCQSPLCNPSRTSLMTSRRPSTSGVYGLAPWFREVEQLRDIVTLPQAFHREGYRTLLGGKIYHGSYGMNDSTEADDWGPAASVGAKPDQKLIPPTPMGNHPLMDWGVFPHQDEDKGDWKVASWAVEKLENELSQSDQPFFLGAGFFLPHVPCYATQQWFDLYPEESTSLAPLLEGDRNDTPRSSWFIHWKLPEPRTRWLVQNDQLLNLTRSYLASISFVDSQVGRILQAIEASGKADQTIVVLWSDHGYHLGEKAISGKNSLWHRSTHVPLIFAGPGIVQGAKVPAPVELLDIYPTLVDIAGLPESSDYDDLEGISLAPQLRDASTPRSRPAITTHNPDNHAVCTTRYRYIRYADGGEEFYDRETDPNEFDNRIGDPGLSTLIQHHRSYLPRTSRPPVPGSMHRILVHRGDEFFWEGDRINPEKIPE
jgi:arylsulfatase A-like enzyme